MAKLSLDIINVLRLTAVQIEKSENYQWGHMGACNCGFLAQQVTHLTKSEIHQRALQSHGDWNEQLNDYCPTSGLSFDNVITQLLDYGFDIDDLKQLENLGNKEVRIELPGIQLRRNVKKDVILYLQTWAGLMEKALLNRIDISQVEQHAAGEFNPA
jgi:hypothetical protein